MKFRVFTIIFVICAFGGIAYAEDKISFYIECSPMQNCMQLAYANGLKKSVPAAPVQELAKSDIQSATVQTGGNSQPSLVIELSKVASRIFERTTGDHIGDRLIVVLDGRILTAPTITSRITSGRITISSEEGRFWTKSPWLVEVIQNSYKASGRQNMVYVIIASVILLAAAAFVLVPRIKDRNAADQN